MTIESTILTAEKFEEKDGMDLAQKLSSDPKAIKDFIESYFDGNNRFQQRASWVLVALAQKYEACLLPHLERMIDASLQTKKDGIQRNMLRTFQYLSIPEQFQEAMINHCFDILTDRNKPIAIQVFAMTVLNKLIEPYPELSRELCLILEENLPHASAGYRSRAKTILHKKA